MNDRANKELADRIRQKAAELGFCKVGFTTMDDFPRVAIEAELDNPDPVVSKHVRWAHDKLVGSMQDSGAGRLS